jgi:hypothetical protein
MLTKLLGSKWLFVAGGLLVLSLAVTARAYLSARDDLAETKIILGQWQQSAAILRSEVERQHRLREAEAAARIALAERVEELSNREAEVITEVREVWRDREVVTQTQADCAVEPMPARIVGLLCDASGTRGGACL